MIANGLSNILRGGLAITSVALLFFIYVCWLGPSARTGRHNQQQSYLVRPGMTLSQALEILGQPQEKKLQEGGGAIYTYPAHPFAADDIYLAIGSNGIVKNINHGE